MMLPAGWKLWGAVILGIMVLAILGAVISWRLKAEHLDKARDVVEESVPAEGLDRKTLVEKLTAAEAKNKEWEQRDAQWAAKDQQHDAALQTIAGQLASLAARRASTRAEIDALAEQELEPRIKRDLGLRRPEDARPGFYREELVAIGHAVAELPQCEAQRLEQEHAMGELKGRVESLEGRVVSIQGQVTVEREKNAAHQEYELKLLGHYREAVNAIGLRRRAGKCIYLWKCGERKLPVPKPEELAVEKP